MKICSMKSKFTLLLCIAVMLFWGANAQNYKWATGGGSTSSLMYSTDWEQVTHMCTDANRNIYVTTTMGDDNITADTFFMAHAFNPTCCGATPRPHIFIASYNPKGKIRWGKLIDAQFLSGSYGIESDNAGNIYTIGYLVGNNKHFGYDTVVTTANLTAFLIKYDTSGNFKWVRFIGADTEATADATQYHSAMAIDGGGFIHYYSLLMNGVQITPTIISTRGTYDLKYDSLGNLINVNKIAIDSNENFYKVIFNKQSGTSYANILSIEPSTGNAKGSYIEAFDTLDNKIWVDSASFISAEVVDIDYDGNGNIYGAGIGQLQPFYIGGDTVRSKNISTNVCAIFKLDTLGDLKWMRKLEGSSFRTIDNIAALTVTSSGFVAGCGTFGEAAIDGVDSIVAPNSEGWNPLVYILDTSGRLIKLDQLHGDAFYDLGKTIVCDNVGNIYIGGFVGDSIYATGIPAYYNTGGETDFFIIKYGYNDGCNLGTEPTPMFSVSGDSTHVPATVTFTYTGANAPDSVKWVFGDGSISSTLNPSHSYTDTGVIQVCLTVYGCDSGTYCNWITTLKPTGVNNVKVFPGLQVYPSPVSDELTIDNVNVGTAVRIFDLVGRQMYATTATENKQMIDVHELQTGVYVLQLTNKTGQKETVRFVKAQ